MRRACLVLGFLLRLRDAAPGRLDKDRFVRAVGREAIFGLDLSFAIGSSEVDATLAVAPTQPCLGKSPGRAEPEGV
jgi:hypothetical protein